MIVDVLKNKELYYNVHGGFKAAFEFIEKAVTENYELGKYEIDGKNIYAMIQEYETKESGNWECHRKYIDIQFIVSGEETIGWNNISAIPEGVSYNEEKDCSLFPMECGTDVLMKDNMYCVLFPQDLHQPGMKYKTVGKVKKIVVKIAV